MNIYENVATGYLLQNFENQYIYSYIYVVYLLIAYISIYIHMNIYFYMCTYI
jgi:hypothetical protein